MKYQFTKLFIAVVLLAASLFVSGTTAYAQMMDGAHYTVTFKSTWTPKTHPFEYPESGLLSGPHFSGLIGATHADGYTLF
ncbi:MAG: hypothetical protein L0Y80_07340, partial [Ignavibacteriae bacterium]|nr:hypothetical protein [Ignavibacteriota bacterium]